MGVCMSLIAKFTGGVEYPGAEVALAIQEQIEGIATAFEERKTEITNGIDGAKSREETDFPIKGGKDGELVLQTLPLDAEEKAIKKAAYMMVAKGTFATEAAASVWSKIEAKLDESKPSEEAAIALFNKAKESFQAKVEGETTKAIEAACDERIAALEKE